MVPFWILQLAELLAAVALADLSLHVDRGGLLVAGTAVFALLAITANGPLGLVRVVPRRLHVHAVCMVAVVFALAPILPQIRPDVSGIIIIEFGAVGLFRLATLTNTVVTVRPPRGSARATAQAANQPAASQPAVPTSTMGSAAATGATSTSDPSTGAGAAPRSATEKVPAPETAGRWISRQASAAVQHAGIAAEAAALTAEKHAPAARAQAGRAVRSAGRLTGRLTRSVGSASAPRSNSSGPAPASPGPSGSAPEAGEPSESTDIQGPEDPK